VRGEQFGRMVQGDAAGVSGEHARDLRRAVGRRERNGVDRRRSPGAGLAQRDVGCPLGGDLR
jgi:hypothetical protein